MLKRAKSTLILFSVLYILLGLVLMVWPGASLRTLTSMVGLVVLACGISCLVRYFRTLVGFFRHFLLASGIVCCAAGAFLLVRPSFLIGLLPVIFGLFIIFDSLVRFGDVMQLRRTDTPVWGVLILVVLSCALGVMMVVNPFGTADAMMMAVGAILIVEGVMNLSSTLYTGIQVRRYLKHHPEVMDAAEAARRAVAEGEPTAVDVEFREVTDTPEDGSEP